MALLPVQSGGAELGGGWGAAAAAAGEDAGRGSEGWEGAKE